MRIIEVISHWPPETFVVRHLQALNMASGLEVEIVTRNLRNLTARDASIEESPQIDNHVQYLRDYHSIYRLSKLPELIRAPFYAWDDANILRYFRRRKPDLVHFHYSYAAVPFRKYLEILKIPYTLSLRGTDIQIIPLMQSSEANQALCDVLSRAARIHSVCDAFHKIVFSLCKNPAPIETIRTCIPTLPNVTTVSGSSQDTLRFVAVGRLHWTKAYQDLIHAMLLVPDAELDIIGNGPALDHLTYLINYHKLNTRVRILGKLPYRDIAALLNESTAFVQSSVAEGFGNALAEAMMLGKPVFVTAVGGTCEIIVNHQNGIIIPMGDPRGIADKLKLARDTKLLKVIGDAARETAQKEFSMSKHAQRFADFFRTALNT